MRLPSLFVRALSVLFLLVLLLALIPITPSAAAPAPDASQPTVQEADPSALNLAGKLALYVPFESVSSGETFIFPYETDVTGFLPDSSYEVWSWAEDGQYLYLVGVKKNVSVALVTVDKGTRSVVRSTVKNINGVDRASVGLKWGRVYMVTYTVEHDGSCGSAVHWDFWRVSGSTWTHVYRTSHKEGGSIWYLVTTDNYLYAIGDYSSCASWGTKIVRLDRNENARVWTSETGTKFYSNHAFSTRNKVYFVHVSLAWNLYLEEYPENTSSFFSHMTKVGEGSYGAFATDGTNRVVFLGTASADGKVHAIINGADRVVFDRRSFMAQAWAASNGRFYGVFRERDANRWHVVEVHPSSRTVTLAGKTWSGRMVGPKFMPFGAEDNPGFVLNRSDGRKILVTLNDPWNVSDTTPPSISNIRESADPISRQGCSSPTTTVIRADVSDTSGLAWVRLYYQAPGSSTWQYTTMTRESGNMYKATLGPFSIPGTARYYIKARDNAGNTGTSSTYTVTVNDCGGGTGGEIFPYETDVTGFLPDSSYEVWSWAEDGQYLYLVGVKKNVSVALVTVDKGTRSVVRSTVKNINGVDRASVGLKWGRVYMVTYTVEHDGSCGSAVHWDFWRVSGSTWTHVYRTSHKEGGSIWYLVTTDNYLYAIGDYSSCASWGTKIVRLDRNENARVWTSETGTKFYSNHAFSTRNKVYFVHVSLAWNLYLEEYPENTSSFFSHMTKVGEGSYGAFATDGTNRVVFLGTASADGKVHAIINGADRVVFDRRSFMAQAWAASNGRFYGVFRERDANRWHVVEVHPSSRTVTLAGKTWSGRMVGPKFMPFGAEDNPGFVLNRSDGRKILVTLKSPWNEECTGGPQPLDIVLTVDRSGSMDGQPLTDAKNAAKSFLGYLDPSVDKVALVSFSGSARLDQGLTHNFDLVRTALDQLSAGGNTAIGDAIKKAANELGSSRHRQNAASVIILLSDGDNTTGSNPLQQAQAAKNQGIRIITIGLGDSVNETLLQQIASSTSDYYFAPNSSDLQAIYRSIAGSICRSAPPKLYMPTIMRGVSTGIVSGKVVNATNSQPIQNAQVCILETTQCTRTDNQGRYVIRQVPVGRHRVRASANGYISVTEEIQVQPGATVTVNFALSPSLAQGEIRIVLSWGLNPRDLDSHLWLPAARPYHVYYANKGDCSVFPYACLDVDDTTSYGPETITIKQRFDGTYVYAVHHFTGSGSLATSGATVRVYDSSGLIREFHVPSGSGIWWYVFDMDGRTGRITPRNYITSSSPGPYTTIEPERKALPVGK